ncbi:MAG: 5'-nucleotidase, lipoprotein e(P4) family [Gemmatimonadota bacterium]
MTASLLVAGLAFAGCAGSGTAPPGPSPAATKAVPAAEGDLPSPSALAVLDAVLWMQTSAEYAAMSRQTYAAAARLLPEALADTSWTAALEQGSGAGDLPPAVILDVDETVLDNSPYAARLIERDEAFTEESWAVWVDEARAKPVPGALEFVRAAREAGVEVFYVTNRLADLEEATRRNLEAMGFPPGEADDVYLLKDEREGWGSDKTSRRAWIAERYRVLMLGGDDLNDFTTGARGTSVEDRADLVERHDEKWGSRWFVFANPTYGSWVSPLLEGLESPSPSDVVRRKLQRLNPDHPPSE